jgi:hypothetical protein
MTGESELIVQIEADDENRQCIDELVRQISTGAGITPFVGAGMSIPYGFPGWSSFLLGIASKWDVTDQVSRCMERGLFEKAAEICKQAGEDDFQVAMSRNFGNEKIPHPLLGPICLLPKIARGPVVTTNFDHLVEAAFHQAGRDLQAVWGSRATLAIEAFHRNSPVLLKIHGDISDPNERILTEEEYNRYYGNAGSSPHDSIAGLIQLVLTVRPLLFLGCSLNRDRIVMFLERFYQAFRTPQHFAVVERPADRQLFLTRKRHLLSHGIRPIWYPPGRHDGIEAILKVVVDRAVIKPPPPLPTWPILLGAVLGLSFSTWLVFYFESVPLDLPGTSVVMAGWTFVVLVANWLLHYRRNLSAKR